MFFYHNMQRTMIILFHKR